MIETVIMTVPTLWTKNNIDAYELNPVEEKRNLDIALHKEHYRVKLMNNFEYRGILFTQYVLERRIKG